MKEKTCCFTGHRSIPKEEFLKIEKLTEEKIVYLIKTGITNFITGGALGFDTLAAETIIRLKGEYPQIKLILVLPCSNQTDMWSHEDKIKYDYIKSKADRIEVLSATYYRGCMHKLNRQMVDNSMYCISYIRKQSGGTAYTVNYATKKRSILLNV